MLTKSWPALRPWIMDWLVLFRSLNCELRFSKVVNLKVDKDLSKWTHGAWILSTCIVWVMVKSVLPEWGKECVLRAAASLECAQSWGQQGLGQGTQGFPGAAVAPQLHLRLNWNRRAAQPWFGVRGDGLVWVWMFHPMHVLLSSCNISSGASQSLISCDHRFTLQNINVDKCTMITGADGFEILCFHSSCLYWPVSVAINSMGLWNLVHAARSCLRNPSFPWHCSVSVLCRMPDIPFSHPFWVLLGCFDSVPLCSIRGKFLGLCFSGNLENFWKEVSVQNLLSLHHHLFK